MWQEGDPIDRNAFSIVHSGSLPDSTAEIYRNLFVSLDLPADVNPVIGVTSAIRGEGRSTVALGLATTLAHDLDGTKVFLVDADFDHPTLSKHFDGEGLPGLAEVLRGERLLGSVAVAADPNLYIIPAGTSEGDTPNLTRQLALQDLFRGSQALNGVVVVDFPPILEQAYSALAAEAVNVSVLAVRTGVTPAGMVREAITRLDDDPPRGIVLTGAVPSSRTSFSARLRSLLPGRAGQK